MKCPECKSINIEWNQGIWYCRSCGKLWEGMVVWKARGEPCPVCDALNSELDPIDFGDIQHVDVKRRCIIAINDKP